jgi:MFS superfamily sulfate permease-like transporter/CRP-like cAMP-binding protein
MTPVASFASLQSSSLAILMTALGARSELLPLAVLVLLLLTGVLQIALGLAGAARLAKFVPFPVVSGFKSGLGILLLLTFAPTLFGAKSIASLWESGRDPDALNPHLAVFTAALLAFALVARRLLPARVPTMPVTVLAGIAAYHGLRLSGYEAQLGATLAADGGWSILGSDLSATLRLASDGATLMSDGRAAGALLVSSVTLALVGLLDTVFATRAAQSIAEGPAAPRRAMVGLGVGTMAAAAFGGVGLSTSFTLTVANYRAGGRTRLSTIASSLVILIVVLALPGALSAVPLCILPPLITFVGWGMLDPYTGAVLRRAVSETKGGARTQTRRDALIHLSVLAPTALNQPLWGVAIGIVLSCLLFILSMSRPVVRRARDGRVVASKRLRTRSETEKLAARGDSLAVLDLEGPLFFGNAEDLAIAIRAQSQACFVILNLKGVTDIDGTGANVIGHARQTLASCGRILLLAETPDEIEPALNRAFPVEHRFHDLDDALEFAENALTGEFPPDQRRADQALHPDRLDLAEFELCEGASPSQLALLASLLREERVPAGAMLCREGDPACCLWLIRAGALSVRVGSGRSDRRLAAYGAGKIMGEMALIENKPRSASVVADEDVDLYMLTRDAYNDIVCNHPDLASLLFKNISRELSDRLRLRSNELRAALS